MRCSLMLSVGLTISLLFAFQVRGLAQQTDSIKVPAISKVLFWKNRPKEVRIDQSTIEITAGEKTDMFRDPNVTYNTDNAPKLLFEADSNFILSAFIQHRFASKWDGGALVLKQDSLRWVKFCFEKDYTGARRVVSVVTNGISDDCNSVKIRRKKVYFKIAKADNVITLYYSTVGKEWFLVRHFTFDANANLKVGFLAQSPTGTACKVKFSDIQYSTRKIEDPYLGE